MHVIKNILARVTFELMTLMHDPSTLIHVPTSTLLMDCSVMFNNT
jgi:hypothetical protein